MYFKRIYQKQNITVADISEQVVLAERSIFVNTCSDAFNIASLEIVSNWSHRLICLSSPGRTN